MATRETKIESFDQLKALFLIDKWSMIHCAVCVPSMLHDYKHHYIVLGHKWNSEYEVTFILHYTTDNAGKCNGKTRYQRYSKNDFERDIENGLYVIDNDRYPKTEKEFNKAYDRFQEKEHEENYSIEENNCEHLTNYVLLGKSFSGQVENLSWYKRIFTGACDCSVQKGSRQNSFFSLSPCSEIFQSSGSGIWRFLFYLSSSRCSSQQYAPSPSSMDSNDGRFKSAPPSSSSTCDNGRFQSSSSSSGSGHRRYFKIFDIK